MAELRGEAGVMAELRNIVRKKNGGRGASSRGVVPRIDSLFCGRCTQVSLLRPCVCGYVVISNPPRYVWLRLGHFLWPRAYVAGGVHGPWRVQGVVRVQAVRTG